MTSRIWTPIHPSTRRRRRGSSTWTPAACILPTAPTWTRISRMPSWIWTCTVWHPLWTGTTPWKRTTSGRWGSTVAVACPPTSAAASSTTPTREQVCRLLIVIYIIVFTYTFGERETDFPLQVCKIKKKQSSRWWNKNRSSFDAWRSASVLSPRRPTGCREPPVEGIFYTIMNTMLILLRNSPVWEIRKNRLGNPFHYFKQVES